VVRAVADPARPLVLTMPRTGEQALAVPLYPLSGGAHAMGAILLPLEPGETAADAEALAAQVGDGAVEVNGRVVEAGDFALILAGALAVEGRAIGPRFVAVQPYVEGREAALQPITDPSRLWLWPLGLALVLALAASYRRFAGSIRFVPRLGAGTPRPAAPAPRAASPHFAPLTRQEDVNDPEAPVAGERILAGAGAALGLAVTAARLLLRGAAALLRLLWAGVGELRSPR
jgi:hypothetical protein